MSLTNDDQQPAGENASEDDSSISVKNSILRNRLSSIDEDSTTVFEKGKSHLEFAEDNSSEDQEAQKEPKSQGKFSYLAEEDAQEEKKKMDGKKTEKQSEELFKDRMISFDESPVPLRSFPKPKHERSVSFDETDAKGKNSNEPIKSFEYEFNGPIGVTLTMISLPVIVIGLFYSCTSDFCVDGKFIRSIIQRGPIQFPSAPSLSSIFSVEAFAICALWLAFQIFLERNLPAEVKEGTVLSTGKRLKYRINGHLAFWVTLLVLCHGMPEFELQGREITSLSSFRLSVLYDRYVELAFAACIISTILSLLLYTFSFRKGEVLIAKPGNSGNVAYNFFMGRELNPRPLGQRSTFDLKFFCELRPGLIGWVILNLGMLSKQAEKYAYVSPEMVSVVFCQGMYVWDALFHEKSVLTTMDITTDGFGYMLAFGDLAWVPFVYTLQTRYLVDRSPGLPLWYVAFLLMLHFLGYALFRGSNSQKDKFRTDPDSLEVAHLEYLQTKRGTKLLISGYWGAARKINYTGDYLMSLSWCLFCGFNSPVPYFYALYFLVLLVHRASRDDHICSEKYGEDWKEYKRKVPYMFIPKLV